VAYSPKHAGLFTGLVAVLATPNRMVAGGLVVLGWAVDTTATYIGRRFKKGDD
jgi:hypothetical protein